jgi:hypothetical protein
MESKYILYQKMVDFADYFLPVVDRFPKYEKFALNTTIKNTVYELIRLCIEGNKSREKLKFLYAIDNKKDFLMFLIGHAYNRKTQEGKRYLDTGNYERAAKSISEIGKIIGGLLKNFQK